jgi:hypothetical protein
MPFKLSTTIGKIQNIPNPKNIEDNKESLKYYLIYKDTISDKIESSM